MDDNVIPMLGRKAYRRRKRFQGATWTPPTISAAIEDGVWCPSCRIRHGYKSSEKLIAQYEKGSNGNWKILWVCKTSSNVLKEVNLGAVRLPEGGRGEDRTEG